MQALEAVQIVETVLKATKRIPESMKGTPFYGALVFWDYVGEDSPNQCDNCKDKNGLSFSGSQLRTLFPDHIIESEDRIWVNYHMTLWGVDTCKCYLERATPSNWDELAEYVFSHYQE